MDVSNLTKTKLRAFIGLELVVCINSAGFNGVNGVSTATCVFVYPWSNISCLAKVC